MSQIARGPAKGEPVTPIASLLDALNAADTGTDLRVMFENAARATFGRFARDGGDTDALFVQWLANRAGTSLLAYLTDDGTIAKVQDMPTAEAKAFHAQWPLSTAILATWDRADPQ